MADQEFARQVAGGQDAVGKRFRIERTPTEPEASFEIIGVVGNAKFQDLREAVQPVVFLPLSKEWLDGTYSRFMIRSQRTHEDLVRSVREKLDATNPGIRYSFHEFDTWIDESLRKEHLLATVSAWFGALALVLTTIGLYAVISYMVVRRTNEIGIRMALGAQRRNIIWCCRRLASFL